MRVVKNILIIILTLLLAVSCKRFNPFAERELIARVGDAKLYESDVSTLFSSDMTTQDSVEILEAYVDMWIKRQLKTQEAESKFRPSESDIDKRVEEYRSSLLGHKLDNYYVDIKLDTLFADTTIRAYYNKNRADFLLDRNIVKGRAVMFPDNFRQKRKMRELIAGDDEKLLDFRDISSKNNFEITELTTWTDFDVFLGLLPVSRHTDNEYLLDEKGVIEMNDGENVYLAYLTDVMKQGEASPFERVENIIRRVLFNQRKQDIIKEYEDSLYRVAVDDKKIEILLRDRK